MKIVVFLKKVPDTGIPIKVSSGGDDIVRDSSLSYVTNPYDEYAVEEALKIREKLGDVEIVAISLGDENTKDILRNALALGVDRTILLRYDDFHWLSGHRVASVLAKTVKEEGFDLILMGKEAVDLGEGQVGGYLAEHLSVPIVSYIVKLDLEDGTARVEREVDEGREVLKVKLPAILTCEKGLNEPRLPSLRGIMMAKKKPIEERPVEGDLPYGLKKMKLHLPPEKKPGEVIKEDFPQSVVTLVKKLREEAKVI